MNKKVFLLLSTVLLSLVSCYATNNQSSSISNQSQSSLRESTILTSFTSDSTGQYVEEEFMYFPKQVLEVGQKEYMFAYASEFKDLNIESVDSSIAEYISSSKMLIGHKVGFTKLRLLQGGKCQMVDVEVVSEKSLDRAWTFESITEEKVRKNFIVIGDFNVRDCRMWKYHRRTKRGRKETRLYCSF